MSFVNILVFPLDNLFEFLDVIGDNSSENVHSFLLLFLVHLFDLLGFNFLFLLVVRSGGSATGTALETAFALVVQVALANLFVMVVNLQYMQRDQAQGMVNTKV